MILQKSKAGEESFMVLLETKVKEKEISIHISNMWPFS